MLLGTKKSYAKFIQTHTSLSLTLLCHHTFWTSMRFCHSFHLVGRDCKVLSHPWITPSPLATRFGDCSLVSNNNPKWDSTFGGKLKPNAVPWFLLLKDPCTQSQNWNEANCRLSSTWPPSLLETCRWKLHNHNIKIPNKERSTKQKRAMLRYLYLFIYLFKIILEILLLAVYNNLYYVTKN